MIYDGQVSKLLRKIGKLFKKIDKEDNSVEFKSNYIIEYKILIPRLCVSAKFQGGLRLDQLFQSCISQKVFH